MSDPPDYLERNRRAWEPWAADFVAPGRASWASPAPHWGIWSIPESEVGFLPADLDGRDTLELGCGAGYVSAWLKRRGARPVGLDPTPEQLASARRFQAEFDLRYPLVMAAAEAVPFADASFDVVVSEYGASIWSDPYRWLPEAARVLRPGGELTFMVNGTLLVLTMNDDGKVPAGDRLRRDYFGLHRVEWPDEPSVEFHLGHGDWIRLLRANHLEVIDLIELRPGEDARTRYEFVDLAWARRWPSEQVWKARKRR